MRRPPKGKRKKPKHNRSVPSRSAANPRGEPVALKHAKQLFSGGHYDQALKQFGKAVRENRWNPQVLVDAARAYAARFAPEKSEALLQRALKVGGERHDIQFVVGETYRMLGQFDAAERCFRRAVFLADQAPRAELELANLCERTHRLDEGLQLVARVLTRWPDSTSAAILKARLLRRSGASEEAESVLRDMLQTTTAKATLQAEAWGELAQLLDAAGRYDEAWSSMEVCKQIMIQRSAAELRAAEHVGNRFGCFVDNIREEHFQRWSQASFAEPKRLGLLTGFPRTGTTLLEQVLDAHPLLCSSEERDILSGEIFANLSANHPRTPVEQLLDNLSVVEIAEARSRYYACTEAYLPEPIGDRYLIDKNPAMTPMIPVVLRLFPEMRLLVALRDPRDVVLSCYLRYLPLNPVSVCFLTIERAAKKYAADMHAWLRYRQLMQTPWTEVRYEDVVDDWQREARRILDFLQLPWDAGVLEYRRLAREKTVRSPTYDAVTHPVYRSAVRRWENYARYLEPGLTDLQPLVKEFGYE